MPYIGKSPHFGVRNRFIYTASGSETSKSGADDNGATLTFTDGAYVDVYLNGVLLKPNTDYVTTTANTIGSLSALAASDILEVIVYDVFSVSDTVSAASGGTFQGAVGFNGGITGNLDLNTDSAVIKFGADDDVTITHDPDDGLILKSTATADDNPFLLTLQTGETDLAADDVIGKIAFQAPDEGTGTDAILVSAAIQAVAEGDHSSSSNATRLSFMTGASEAAAEKFYISSAGDVVIKSNTNNAKLQFQDQSNSTGFVIQQIGSSGSPAMRFMTSAGDEHLRILNGGGITFNGDTAAANALDDYEDGTWTAAISTTSGSITPDASFKTGHYTKVGKLVTVNLHLRASSVSSPSGSCQITGLPFTTVNNDEYRFSSGACVHFTATGMDAEAVFICYISENQSKITVAMQNGNNLDTSTADNFTTNTELYINLFYYV